MVPKGGLMQDQHMQLIFNQVRKALKEIDLKDGEFLSFSDEHRRMNISPYRMTLEMRFPQGIENDDN